MKLIDTIRKFFLKPEAAQRYEYVRETLEEPVPTTGSSLAGVGTEMMDPAADARIEEIAFSPKVDLESYVLGLDSPKEAIEKWISSGVLSPEETKVASQMIRIICKNK